MAIRGKTFRVRGSIRLYNKVVRTRIGKAESGNGDKRKYFGIENARQAQPQLRLDSFLELYPECLI